MQFAKLIPELIVTDIGRSKQFYLEVLGFTLCYERPEEKFAFVELEGSQIMLLQDNSNPHSRTGALDYPRGQGVNFSINCNNVEPIADALAAAGHPLRIPLREQWNRKDDALLGQMQLWVLDPDGYLLRFIQELGTREAPASV